MVRIVIINSFLWEEEEKRWIPPHCSSLTSLWTEVQPSSESLALSLTGFVILDTLLNIWSFIYSTVLGQSWLDPPYSQCGQAHKQFQYHDWSLWEKCLGRLENTLKILDCFVGSPCALLMQRDMEEPATSAGAVYPDTLSVLRPAGRGPLHCFPHKTEWLS